MDRKSAAYNKSRKGLLMAAILQFWSFKIEDSPSVNGLQKQWYGNAFVSSSCHNSSFLTRSYYKGIELGYLTEDPAAYHDPNVCKPYIQTPS